MQCADSRFSQQCNSLDCKHRAYSSLKRGQVILSSELIIIKTIIEEIHQIGHDCLCPFSFKKVHDIVGGKRHILYKNFTYHAARKSEVESVTVVDVSEDALTLFRTHILPRFEHPEKVHTVCMDAFAFADRHMAGNFDFVFADIWHDAGDGKELYLRMKAYEEAHPDIRFSYWLEDTIRCYLDDSLWDVQK